MLYELSGYKWIADIILELNSLGFYTVTSQPGNSNNNKKYVRKQRAFIRGYMKKNIAHKLVDLFLDNTFIIARSETNNNIPISISECGCGSVNFVSGLPGTMRFDEGKFDQSYNLDLPLRKSYTKMCEITKHLPKGLSDMSEFEIFDIRWDYNDELWQKLLDYYKLVVLDLKFFPEEARVEIIQNKNDLITVKPWDIFGTVVLRSVCKCCQNHSGKMNRVLPGRSLK